MPATLSTLRVCGGKPRPLQFLTASWAVATLIHQDSFHTQLDQTSIFTTILHGTSVNPRKEGHDRILLIRLRRPLRELLVPTVLFAEINHWELDTVFNALEVELVDSFDIRNTSNLHGTELENAKKQNRDTVHTRGAQYVDDKDQYYLISCDLIAWESGFIGSTSTAHLGDWANPEKPTAHKYLRPGFCSKLSMWRRMTCKSVDDFGATDSQHFIKLNDLFNAETVETTEENANGTEAATGATGVAGEADFQYEIDSS